MESQRFRRRAAPATTRWRSVRAATVEREFAKKPSSFGVGHGGPTVLASLESTDAEGGEVSSVPGADLELEAIAVQRDLVIRIGLISPAMRNGSPCLGHE